MYVIGLDVGTSGVKSTLFDEKANAVSYAHREYDLISQGEGMYELDPQVLLKGAKEVLARSSDGFDRKAVRAICITSFGESFVCLDGNDRILRNTMIYMDRRGKSERDEFTDMLGEEAIFDKCGQFADPMFALYKLRHLSRREPEVFKRTKRLLFICDFIAYMLGADHCCDYSLAARSAMFDIRKKQWWDEAVEFAGIDKSILPTPVPGGSAVGTLSRMAAKELGMEESVKLILGGHDQILAAVGSGAYEAGDVANGMGTVDCFTGVMDGGSLNMPALLKHNLPVVPFLHEERYVTYAFAMSGGCIVKWFRDTLAKDIANKSGAYDLLSGEAPDKPTGLFVIPYLAGGGTPYMDETLPAVIAGLRLTTSRGEMYRAFLEGEAYEMKRCLDCLLEAGIAVNRIFAVGGGSKSPFWMQLRADVFDQRIFIPKNNEAGTLASAMLCYVNLGLYKDIEQAQKQMVQNAAAFEPDAENAALYQKLYEQYKLVYTAVKSYYK